MPHKKKRPKSVQGRAIKRSIARAAITAETQRAKLRQNRTRLGDDVSKSADLKREPSPGVKARVKNLQRTGQQVPTTTKGKLAKGGPVKRTISALNKRGFAKKRKS